MVSEIKTDFEIYDMIVFVTSDESIHQTCIDSVSLKDGFAHTVDGLTIDINNGQVTDKNGILEYELAELWRRSSLNIYVRIY